MTIKTNNRPKNLLSWYELTEKEQQEFTYLETEDSQSEANFFRYLGNVYELGEFMRIEQPMASNCQFGSLAKWDGYSSDSYFSGILVKYVNDCEQVIVGTYID